MRSVVIIVGIALAVVGVLLLVMTPPETPQQSRRGNGSAATGGADWFENVVPDCGIDFEHRSGHQDVYYLPESMSGGVGLLDYDRDGRLDAYFVQGGTLTGGRNAACANRLYQNLGNGRFQDVTDGSGTGNLSYGMGCACGDVDGDGWTDIYVTNVGPNVLYRNNTDGTFSDVTSTAGVGDPSFSSSASFVDYDHDGDLDIFVVNYVVWSAEREIQCFAPNGLEDYCTPNAYRAPARDTLYRNNGNGTFTDVSEASGISRAFGNGLGVVCGDLNGDGWVDITVANDLLANQLWINLGDGTFRDEALERGAAFSGTGMAESGMGIDAQDVDGDGDLDLYMTHFDAQTNTYYRNDDGFFVDDTNPAGLGGSLPYVGFGTALIDLNNDGWLDVFAANGRVVAGPRSNAATDRYALPNQLFEGTGDGRFREVMPRGGTTESLVYASRGAAFGDFDDDGAMDIFIVNRDAPATVLRNRMGQNGNWITFRVVNERGCDAIGARVQIQAAKRRWTRDVRSGSSYCSSNDPRVHFGLGRVGRIDEATVQWPDHTISRFGAFGVNQIAELRRRATDMK